MKRIDTTDLVVIVVIVASLVLVALLASCNQISRFASCPANPQPFDSQHQTLYDNVRECTGLDAPPIPVSLEPTTECPTSGRRNCLKGYPKQPCRDDPGKTCGIAGVMKFWCGEHGVIVLPDEQPYRTFRHEVIHHLLLWNTGNVDVQHQSPLFQQCQ